MWKKTIATAAMAGVLAFAIAGCSASSSAASSPASPSASSSASASAESPLREALKEKVGSSTFYDSVRNDKTGRWKCFVYYASDEAQDIAADYYKAYFGSDDEIHALVNLGLRTTANVSVMGNELMIDVHEYVDGEEHDAVKMFGGDLLAQYAVNKDTGEVEKM